MYDQVENEAHKMLMSDRNAFGNIWFPGFPACMKVSFRGLRVMTFINNA